MLIEDRILKHKIIFLERFFVAVLFIFSFMFIEVGWCAQQVNLQYMINHGVNKNLAIRIANAAGKYSSSNPNLVIAIIQAESNFNPKAIGKFKDKGLMQITRGALREVVRINPNIRYAPNDLFNVEYNILIGCKYLEISYWRMKRYLPDGYDDLDSWAAAIGYYKDGFNWSLATFIHIKKIMAFYKQINNEF